MPAKKVGFGKKPTSKKTPDLDEWVEQRNVESETKTKDTSPSSLSPQPPKMKRLTIDVSEELHRAIKMKAVEQGTAMADMLRSLLEQNYL